MRIAVLGGGNGAYAAAADLSDQGHEIRFWRRDRTALAALRQAGGAIVLEDFRGARPVPLALVSDDLAPALADAELIVIPAPAFAQAEIARQIAPHLTPGQVVLLPPGSFGSYAMARLVRDAGCRAIMSFAELGTLPYLARMQERRRSRSPPGRRGCRPASFRWRARRRHSPRSGKPIPASSLAATPVSGALMNAGPIIHPPLILMNAGPLEHFERWDIHNEGTQPSIRRVTTALDQERIAVRAALGYGPPHFPLADHYDPGVPAAPNGCTAMSRMSVWSAAATGARRSIL